MSTMQEIEAILEKTKAEVAKLTYRTPLEAALVTVTVSHISAAIEIVQMAASAEGANIDAPEEPAASSH